MSARLVSGGRAHIPSVFLSCCLECHSCHLHVEMPQTVRTLTLSRVEELVECKCRMLTKRTPAHFTGPGAKHWNRSEVRIELQADVGPAVYKLGMVNLSMHQEIQAASNLAFFPVASSLWCSQDSLRWHQGPSQD